MWSAMPQSFAHRIKCATTFRSWHRNFTASTMPGKVLDKNDMELSAQRLALVKAAKITLRNALDLIGVEALEKM